MIYQTQTILIRVDPQVPAGDAIQQAAAILRDGRLVAFPTETVYGLGANALDAAAIARIFQAKQRPANDPVIVHIHVTNQFAELARDVPPVAYQLAKRFWPGPLTLVLRRATHVPANIAAGLETVAIRMPAHPVARALLKAANLPIAAPSANTFTRPSATTAAHVLEDLDGHVDLVLDAGPTTIGLESTVLDLTGETPLVLRPGGVTLAGLREIVPSVQMSPRYIEGEAATSPGQMLKHYSPLARVILHSGPREAVLRVMAQTTRDYVANGKQVGALIADEDALLLDAPVIMERLGSQSDLETISHRLFAAMRALDGQGVDVILARDFGREGLGAALWDRLLRAAEGEIVQVEA